MTHCIKCGTKTMLMSGYITLEIDDEPYESGKYEKSKTGVTEIENHILAHYCETCEEIANTFNE